MTSVKNLGTVKALHIGLTPPVNNKLLWYDTNIGQNVCKRYDLVNSVWVILGIDGQVVLEDYLNRITGGDVLNKVRIVKTRDGNFFEIVDSVDDTVLLRFNEFGQIDSYGTPNRSPFASGGLNVYRNGNPRLQMVTEGGHFVLNMYNNSNQLVCKLHTSGVTQLLGGNTQVKGLILDKVELADPVVDGLIERDVVTGKLYFTNGVNRTLLSEMTTQEILSKIGNGSLIDSQYLPAYVDDVLEFDTFQDFPVEGEQGKIYVALQDSVGEDPLVHKANMTYRWSGTAYISLSNPLDYATQTDVEQASPTNNEKVVTPLRAFQGFIYWIKNSIKTETIEVGDVNIQTLATDSWLDNIAKSVLDGFKKLKDWLKTYVADTNLKGVPETEWSKWVWTFDATTRIATLTLSSDSYYYTLGKKYTISAGVYNFPQWGSTNGQYFFYFNSSGVATTSAVNTSWDIKTTCQLINGYYNSNNNGTGPDFLSCFEMHPTGMSAATHSHLHRTEGAKYVSGGALSGYSIQSDTVTAVTWGMDSATFDDENITLSTDVQPQLDYLIGWFDSVNDFHWKVQSDLPYLYGANNRIMYDPVGANPTQVPTTNDQYINSYTFLINSYQSSKRVLTLMGQNIFTTLTNAQNSGVSSLNLGSLPFVEWVMLWQTTYRYRTTYSAITKGVRIEAEPRKLVQNPVTITGTVGVHNNLSGRSDANAHPDTAISNTPATVLTGTNQADNNTIINTYLDDMVAKSKNLSDLENRQTAVNNLFDATNLALGQTLVKDENGNMVAGEAGAVKSVNGQTGDVVIPTPVGNKLVLWHNYGSNY